MKLKPVFIVIMFLLITLAQLALNGSFSFFSGKVNLLLLFLVVFINILSWEWVMVFAIIAGLLTDLYSGLPFGLLTLTLFLTAIATEMLFINFFTNFSFYSSLALSLIALFFHNLFLAGCLWLLYFLGWSERFLDVGYLWLFLQQAIVMVIAMPAIYLVINSMSRHLKPIFLK
jgi:rod shape-determining protein MreD